MEASTAEDGASTLKCATSAAEDISAEIDALDLDTFLDTDVMQFVNQAIANAMRDTGLNMVDDGGIDRSVSTNLKETLLSTTTDERPTPEAIESSDNLQITKPTRNKIQEENCWHMLAQTEGAGSLSDRVADAVERTEIPSSAEETTTNANSIISIPTSSGKPTGHSGVCDDGIPKDNEAVDYAETIVSLKANNSKMIGSESITLPSGIEETDLKEQVHEEPSLHNSEHKSIESLILEESSDLKLFEEKVGEVFKGSKNDSKSEEKANPQGEILVDDEEKCYKKGRALELKERDEGAYPNAAGATLNSDQLTGQGSSQGLEVIGEGIEQAAGKVAAADEVKVTSKESILVEDEKAEASLDLSRCETTETGCLDQTRPIDMSKDSNVGDSGVVVSASANNFQETLPTQSTKLCASEQIHDRHGESGLALVNDRLRVRITELQSQIKDLCCELAFVGDRNWRLEAYMDCLIHTLEKMGVTDVEDLDRNTLPLDLFKVKVKAGYRLGPYNRLPQRARRSYQREGITPPDIDLSGGSLKCQTQNDAGKVELAFNIVADDDIGLSVQQMTQYENRIEMLAMENHFLKTQLQQITTSSGPSPSNSCSNIYNNHNFLPPPPPQAQPELSPLTTPFFPTGMTENYGAPLEQSPGVHNMIPIAPPPGMYNGLPIEGRDLEKAASSPQLQPFPTFPPPPTEGVDYSYQQYDNQSTFRPNHEPTNLATTRDPGRQSVGIRHRNDDRFDNTTENSPRGRSSIELGNSGSTFMTGPGGYRRTERTRHQTIRRTPSHCN